MNIRAFAGAIALASLTFAAAPAAHAQANTLTAKEKAHGWRLLFDGTSLDAWRGYKMDAMPVGWRVADGVIVKDSSAEDIVTRDSFANFELVMDWKIAKGGNSGIFYRGTEEYDHIYWSAPEYQLLDDANAPDGASRLTSAGADYALYPSPAGIEHPAGEWNTARIVVRGNHVEHWMNGKKLLSYTLGSADWAAKVKASKFGKWPNYGKATRGLIGVQGDHSGRLELRNIKIRVLPAK
ncbi:MAG TPA: DUF1080 domain-containing protein [Gemmatimonadales bacterium]|nr:DUF1080 domain-containing protein [Gemmatimonadales bacterium]